MTGGKIGLKGEKDLISLYLKGEILQIVPETLEHSPLHFSDDQFAPLWDNISQIGNKIEKNCIFGSILHSSFHF